MKKGGYYWLEICWFESCIFPPCRLCCSTAELCNKHYTELFTILRHQSGNLKLSVFISKTQLLRFLRVRDVKDVFWNCVIVLWNTALATRNIWKIDKFKHSAHAHKKGRKVLKVITIETQTNNHNKEMLIVKACLPFWASGGCAGQGHGAHTELGANETKEMPVKVFYVAKHPWGPWGETKGQRATFCGSQLLCSAFTAKSCSFCRTKVQSGHKSRHSEIKLCFKVIQLICINNKYPTQASYQVWLPFGPIVHVFL